MKDVGVRGLFLGLDASLLRTTFYGTIRLGLYYTINDWY